MGASRYSISRQKACQACVLSKSKCDRQITGCKRCLARRLSCVYLPAVEKPTRKSKARPQDDARPVSTVVTPILPPVFGVVGTANNQPVHDNVDSGFSVATGELMCPIKADDISIRWMNAYVPTPDQTVKAYQPSTIEFLYRSLKVYSGMVVHGRGIPPFIHPMQMTSGSNNSLEAASSPLSTCLSLARICDTTLAGSSQPTSEAAAAVLKREMDKIYTSIQPTQDRTNVDHMASLAAFQAYLLYALVLFFHLEHQSDPFLRQAIVALQEIACISSRHGLVCVAEQQQQAGVYPRWPSWIVSEAKRRTLYALYLFDSVLSVHDGMPAYLGTELRGLPAPGSKALWQASSMADWTRAYKLHLDEWKDTDDTIGEGYTGLRIDELWPYPNTADVAGLARRRRRVDQWLEGVDEYGTMMYAVTSSTHGG